MKQKHVVVDIDDDRGSPQAFLLDILSPLQKGNEGHVPQEAVEEDVRSPTLSAV